MGTLGDETMHHTEGSNMPTMGKRLQVFCGWANDACGSSLDTVQFGKVRRRGAEPQRAAVLHA